MNSLYITRLGLFVRRQVIINIHSFWIALGAIVGILLLISVLVSYFDPDDVASLQGLYLVVFHLGGYIFTSKIYSELHAPNKSYALLTLPVSNLEKIIGGWLITSPLYILVYIVFMFLLTSINSLIAGHTSAFAHIFSQDVLDSVKIYLVLQTVFFLGACTFKGNNFLKTLLSIFLFFMAVGAFTLILGLISFGGTSIHIENVSPEFQYFMTDVFTPVITFIFWYILGPFMLVVSYFKLKERQI